jgi:maltose alpha-D-glucosyltransferase/alpha-amylase
VIEKATGDLWWKNAVVYCVDVATFLDSDGDGIGDLTGLTERVDYLAGIGVSCLWLMPFYPSPRRDDGYDVTDFYGVDGRFGTPGDFVELIRTAGDRGIRVIADLVPNHTSVDHPWFQSARAGRDSRYHDFYVWTDEKPAEKPGDVVFPDKENSNWAWDDDAGQWYLHRFYSHQPDLNVANPAVRDELAQVIGYWIQQGLAGFRVDAVPFLLEPMGMPAGALHDPHELLKELRRYMGRRRGDAILLGEVNLDPPQVREFFGDQDELHMAFDFNVNQAMYLALAREDAAPLAAALNARPEIPEDCQWATFARNHDELTLDKLTDAEREEVFAAFGRDPGMQLFGRGIRRRLPTMLGGDQDRIRMVYSLVFSLPGTPVLFYGEEIGMAENLEIEGRLSVRSPMRWSRERHAGFSTAPEGAKLVRPLGSDEANVADQRRHPDSLLNFMERLIRRRRESPELGWGRPTVLDAGRPAVFAHRCDWAGSTVVALHNLGPRPVSARLELGPETLVDLFDHDELEPKRTGRVEIPLERYGHRWFALRGEGRRVAP